MAKNIQAYRNQNYKKLFFFDHNHQIIDEVIHSFPVAVKSVADFIDRYSNVEWFGRRQYRFQQIVPLHGWKIYALDWYVTNLFVTQTSSEVPQVFKFRDYIHTNREGFEYHQLNCGCCYDKEWGIPLRYQTLFVPRPIAYISSEPGSR